MLACLIRNGRALMIFILQYDGSFSTRVLIKEVTSDHTAGIIAPSTIRETSYVAIALKFISLITNDRNNRTDLCLSVSNVNMAIWY